MAHFITPLRWFVGVLLISCVVSSSLMAQEVLSSAGTMSGVIERTESDKDGIYAIFLMDGKAMQFVVVEGSKILEGTRADLKKGQKVQIKFRDRVLSEMDYFFTSKAESIILLKDLRDENPR